HSKYQNITECNIKNHLQNVLSKWHCPRAPTPLGTEGVLRCCVCYVVDFCLYASVLDVERCADLVPGFFDIYGGTLCRSAIWFWDSSVLIVVRCADLHPVFFDIYGGTLSRAAAEEG
ncbi:hypothetical protein, partial [Blautia sp. MCC270]|uniref:hypothetical protein n=1 Tax=Blautia sp. MCC270 TaxID=2592639 RepID=UPI001C00BB5A